ncbi:MAG: hypothetical protein KHY44_06085 [Clostridiales bacterium]|nr:hypothetical protein [Clostridiales bacterium]
MEEIKVVEAVDQEVVDVVEEGTMEQETLEPMTEEEFKDFVNGEVLEFLEEFGLKKIQVVDENGNKGTITRYKEMIKVETTIKSLV